MLPLEVLLDDIVTYINANPRSREADVLAYIETTYELTSDFAATFLNVLKTTLMDAGITEGPLWDDIKKKCLKFKTGFKVLWIFVGTSISDRSMYFKWKYLINNKNSSKQRRKGI